jgi:hypothetical protein
MGHAVAALELDHINFRGRIRVLLFPRSGKHRKHTSLLSCFERQTIGQCWASSCLHSCQRDQVTSLGASIGKLMMLLSLPGLQRLSMEDHGGT